jgi:hypothetical protein
VKTSLLLAVLFWVGTVSPGPAVTVRLNYLEPAKLRSDGGGSVGFGSERWESWARCSAGGGSFHNAGPVMDRSRKVRCSMRSARVSLGHLLWCAGGAAQQYVISSYAGGAPALAAAVQGTSVSIGAPISVATDEKGDPYFASPDLNSVFKLDPSGVLTLFAGSSKPGYSGAGDPATAAKMNLFFGNA